MGTICLNPRRQWSALFAVPAVQTRAGLDHIKSLFSSPFAATTRLRVLCVWLGLLQQRLEKPSALWKPPGSNIFVLIGLSEMFRSRRVCGNPGRRNPRTIMLLQTAHKPGQSLCGQGVKCFFRIERHKLNVDSKLVDKELECKNTSVRLHRLSLSRYHCDINIAD
jgi:hypothetical protein